MFMDSNSNIRAIDAKNALYTMVTKSWQAKEKEDLPMK